MTTIPRTPPLAAHNDRQEEQNQQQDLPPSAHHEKRPPRLMIRSYTAMLLCSLLLLAISSSSSSRVVFVGKEIDTAVAASTNTKSHFEHANAVNDVLVVDNSTAAFGKPMRILLQRQHGKRRLLSEEEVVPVAAIPPLPRQNAMTALLASKRDGTEAVPRVISPLEGGLLPPVVPPPDASNSIGSRGGVSKVNNDKTSTQQQRGFRAFDTNHNGLIDPLEYQMGVKKLIAFLQEQPLSAAQPSDTTGATTPADHKRHWGLGGIGVGGKKGGRPVYTRYQTAKTAEQLQQEQQQQQQQQQHKTQKESFWPAFVHSFMMILATEIGDKTFFIAAVLSMKNDRIAVFLGAVAALVIMTILSTMMGFVLPSLIPRQYTTMFGGFLFLYFGMKLLYEGRGMKHGVSDELEEVEEELKIGRNKHHVGAAGGTKKKDEDTYENGDEEEDLKLESNMGGGGGPMMRSGGMKKKESGRDLMSADGGGGKKKIAVGANKNRPSWERIFMQSLSLTFLAEWGDRSQIATIALASHKDPYGVGFGGGLGHSLCTGVAVIGGRMLASRIDEKTVAIAGGFIFLVFGCHSVFFES